PTLTATAPASSSASPNMVSVVSVSGVPVPAPIAVHLKLAANQRLRDRFVRILGMKERPIDALEQQRELTLVRRIDHQHPTARHQWKTAIVEVVAIHRHQRAAQLLRELIVLDVRGAAQIVLLEDEQHVPSQVRT